MGSRKTNFYVDLASRFGFEREAHEVQSLYLDGKRDEAYKAIPDELVDQTSLVGSESEVAEHVERYAKAGVDRLIVSPIHLDPAERKHTVERLATLVGAGTPA
jgi:alkanesulfonate monooxygenase SsuD/methylene tetrahydromethanopterin reductase-like flavin-dependent oxidoreductase (luciferase family)